jgi:hypothetical protein
MDSNVEGVAGKLSYETPVVVDYGPITDSTFAKGAGVLDFAGRRTMTP